MICSIKHTAYQPTDEQWRCPKCGSDNEKFYVDEPVEGSAEECDKLHEQDGLYCQCGYAGTGKSFAEKVMEAQNRIVCPHCKGEGTIKGPINK